MIYMIAGEKKVIVLETANLDELKKGRPATTPDGTVQIGWTPDLGWLGAQIAASDGDGFTIANLIVESQKRPENPTPADAEIVTKQFPKDI